MMNVSCNRLLIAFLALSTLFLIGCKEPEVSMAQLGKKMAAPQLKGTSPFDQDFEVNKYVRFQGGCDIRVGEISISFDNVNFHTLAAVPTYAGTTLQGNETNDAVCLGDGTFDFYVTETEMNGWGVDTNGKVDFIYLRGSTLIGDTQVLTIKDPNPSDGGGSPTHVALTKTWPEGFAGSGKCESIRASTRNATGKYSTSNTAISFTLDKEVSGTVTSKVAAYTSHVNCTAGTSAVTSFSIPAGQSDIELWYRFPDTPIDGVISFRANDVTLPTVVSAYIPVTLRDGSQATRWWFSTSSHNKIRANACVPAQINARYFDGTTKSVSGPVTMSVTGTNSNLLKFYSDANCTTEETSFMGYSSVPFYIKYIGSETSNDTLALTITHSISGYSAGSFDDIPHRLEIERSSGGNTVTFMDLIGATSLSRATCTRLTLNSYNDRGALYSNGQNIFIGAALANSRFYGNSYDCDTQSNPISTLSMTNPSVDLYFRATQVPGEVEVINYTTSGLPSNSRSYLVSGTPTQIALYVNSNSGPFNYIGTQCMPIVLEAKMKDVLQDYTYPNSTGSLITIVAQIPVGFSLYNDNSCTSNAGSTVGLGINPNMTTGSSAQFYIKADSTPSAASFYATLLGPVGNINYLTPASVPLVVVP